MTNDINDSRPETEAHINKVRGIIATIMLELSKRYQSHDASKLEEPEKPYFDKATSKLKGLSYGSEEYKQALRDIRPALDHHYSNNSHHPEHFNKDGISGMTLIDLVEMFCDWCAASHRHEDGDIFKSISSNSKRFGYDAVLAKILENIAKKYNIGKSSND